MADGTRLKVFDDILRQQAQILESLQFAISTQQSSMEQMALQLTSLDGKVNQALRLDDSSSSRSPSGSATFHNNSPPLTRSLRIDFPRFDGSDALGWIFKAEQYFDYYSVDDNQRLSIASFHMDGLALQWYQWMARNKQLSSWSAFTRALEIRFAPMEFEDPHGALAKLQQTLTVADYQATFEALANRTTDLPSEFLVHCFVSGLRPDIKTEVLAFKPTTMNRAIELAQLQETKILELRKLLSKPNPNRSYNPPLNQPVAHSIGLYPSTSPGLLPSPPTSFTSKSQSSFSHMPSSFNQHSQSPHLSRSTPSPIPIRCLTPAKISDKRAKGLCYSCDEKWIASHRCKSAPRLLILDFEEDEFLSASKLYSPTLLSPLSESLLPSPNFHSEATSNVPEISYRAMAGHQSIFIFRFTGRLVGALVHVLVDGGSSHNFIQTRVAQHLKLAIEPSPAFAVIVGSGKRLRTEGCIKQAKLLIQDHEVFTYLYVLPLYGADIVLGISWLVTLGPIQLDYSTLTLGFSFRDQQVVLQGETSPPLEPMQYKSFRRLHDIQCSFGSVSRSVYQTPWPSSI